MQFVKFNGKLDYFLDESILNLNLNILREKYDEIHKEFLENKDRLFWFNWGAEAGYYAETNIAYRGWKVAPLYGLKDDVLDVNSEERMEKYKKFLRIDGDLIKTNNTFALPILTKALLDSGIRKRVGISVVQPGREILWHIDPDPEKSNMHIIRGLWGLDVKEELNKESFIYLKNESQKRVFKNNDSVFFWGRTIHKVENNLSSPRYMICFDAEVPRETF
jgi:hypothetical protein